MAQIEDFPLGELSPKAAARRLKRPTFNRELSWLEFDARVLALAASTDLPVLERAKFLGIFASNLDEFFQIRVAGLKEQLNSGVSLRSPDGLSPAEQLAALAERVRTLSARETQVFKRLKKDLWSAGVKIVDAEELSDQDRKELRKRFEDDILPVLTPLAVDPSHPFPYISNLSLNLAVVVRDAKTRLRRFARVKVPPSIGRFQKLPDEERLVPLEQTISTNADLLFPGMEIVSIHPFRVTRDADVEVEFDEAEDLLSLIEASIRLRERSPEVVRLELDRSMPKGTRELLIEELDLSPSDVYVTRGLLGLGDLMELSKLDRPDLKYPVWAGVTQRRLASAKVKLRSIFDVLQEGDVLVQHPYDSFKTSVARFIDEASKDPSVLAIKQTLYRTSVGDSAIVESLVRAAESGKQTVAMIEPTARFDETTNIRWGRILEESGAHVVYGVVGLKTHAKISLVVRQESDGIRRYCHVGTGNYHPGTATLYEDVGLLTADPDLAADVADLFNYLTGYSRQEDYDRILVAPYTLRRRLVEMIRGEAERRSDGRIVLKMNSLVDEQMIDELYSASQAGVKIDLIVRGICCLVPGVKGVSDNIRVRSLVGRYLEHSRIFKFGEAEAARFLIGSADLMPRNLDHRVECVVAVEDLDLAARLEEILQVCLEDDVLAWELGPDGWSKVPVKKSLETQSRLQLLAQSRVTQSR